MLLGTAAVVTYENGEVVVFQENEGVGRLEGTMNQNEFQVKIITAPLREISRLCLIAVGKFAPGCAIWSPEKCTIWMPDPIGQGDWTAFHIAGHELWHCKIGDFHE